MECNFIKFHYGSVLPFLNYINMYSADIYIFFLLIGNKLTLETRPSKEGVDVRQELLKFHSTYYSSNLMGLCVLGRGKMTLLTHVMLKCCKIII